MSFPWKKVKNTKISQFVKDHVQTHRSKSSPLVVETGFPTSLVDLFVKNKEKFKKPSKKRRPSYLLPPLSPDPLISPSPLATSSAPPPSPSPTNCPSPLPCFPPNGSLEASGGDGNEAVVDVGGDGVDANRVMVAVVKMFLVVVLALWSKRFVVGITMSAFLLFFLEYVWQYMVRLFNLCWEGLRRLMMVMGEVFGLGKAKLDGLFGGSTVFKAPILQEDPPKSGSYFSKNCEPGAPIHQARIASSEDESLPGQSPEIRPGEVVCYSSPNVRENLCAKDKTVISHAYGKSCEEIDKKVDVLEKEGHRCEVSETKRKKSRKTKIKSKMQKLIPKKLRHSKKKDSSIEGETKQIWEDVATWEEQEDDYSVVESESIHDRRSLSLSSGKGEEIDISTSRSSELSEEVVESAIERDEKPVVRGWNSRHLMLCLIVLIGLFGGRILALVLTMSWCLIIKSGDALRKYIKFLQ